MQSQVQHQSHNQHELNLAQTPGKPAGAPGDGVLLVSTAARGELKTFVLDTNNSSLTISGHWKVPRSSSREQAV